MKGRETVGRVSCFREDLELEATKDAGCTEARSTRWKWHGRAKTRRTDGMQGARPGRPSPDASSGKNNIRIHWKAGKSIVRGLTYRSRGKSRAGQWHLSIVSRCEKSSPSEHFTPRRTGWYMHLPVIHFIDRSRRELTTSVTAIIGVIREVAVGVHSNL